MKVPLIEAEKQGIKLLLDLLPKVIINLTNFESVLCTKRNKISATSNLILFFYSSIYFVNAFALYVVAIK